MMMRTGERLWRGGAVVLVCVIERGGGRGGFGYLANAGAVVYLDVNQKSG